MGKIKGKPDKYSVDFVSQEVTKLYKELNENKSIIFIGQLFEDKEYTRQRFSEWDGMNEYISDTIKKIRDLLETRVVAGAMQGELNPTMTIFHLKNNYKWKDQTAIDHTTGGKEIKGFAVEYVENNDKEDSSNKRPEKNKPV